MHKPQSLHLRWLNTKNSKRMQFLTQESIVPMTIIGFSKHVWNNCETNPLQDIYLTLFCLIFVALECVAQVTMKTFHWLRQPHQSRFSQNLQLCTEAQHFENSITGKLPENFFSWCFWLALVTFCNWKLFPCCVIFDRVDQVREEDECNYLLKLKA